jgi:hypothetical protein
LESLSPQLLAFCRSNKESSKVKSLDFRRYALCGSVTAAMLTGCGGYGSGGSSIVPVSGTQNATSKNHTFTYSGKKQSFIVPTNVTQLRVLAYGANGSSQYGEHFGFGARISATIPVRPGERLIVFVGGNASGANGGFNGGENGGSDGCCDGQGGGGGGGGASDVRAGGATLADRIFVAAGGGGQGGQGGGDTEGGHGGRGGGTHGGRGGDGSESYSECNGAGGDGGTQAAGGTGGAGSDCDYTSGGSGIGGKLGAGGAGGAGGSKGVGSDAGAGGGGGGGFYGGGGGGGGADSRSMFGDGGGGGGGSSYVESNATHVRFWPGWRKPHVGGLVVFYW